jgi:hypothetical protein
MEEGERVIFNDFLRERTLELFRHQNYSVVKVCRE